MFLILLASKHTQPISKLKQRRISSFWTSFWNLNGKPPYICSWRRLHGYAKESRIERLTKKGGGGVDKRKKQKIIYFSCVGYMYFRWFWTEQVKSRHWIKDVSWLSADIRAQLKFSSFQRRVLEGGIPTLLVSVIATARHTGVCTGTKAWSCAGNLSETVSSDCLEWYAFIRP